MWISRGVIHQVTLYRREFFLGCDGIFLNYNWTDSGLVNSCILAKDLERDVKDVYVGLDVWGRGCPGGGGYNSAHVGYLPIRSNFYFLFRSKYRVK